MRNPLLILSLLFLSSAIADEDAQIVSPEPVRNVVSRTLDGEKIHCDKSVTDQDKQRVDQFKQVLVCAINKNHPSPPPSAKRMRTINFIAERMVENFDTYGIQTNVEKSHLLAQVLKETGGLTSLIERQYRPPIWRKVMKDANTDNWACEDYYKAVEGDDPYFDSQYEASRDSYKADFRGRGLIQLTHCYNYLGFFYHKAAMRANRPDLAKQHKTVWYYKDARGRRKKVGQFCSPQVLKKMEAQFRSEGLVLAPDELINDFKNTMNKLAIPCKDQKVDPVTSQEFLIDSTFWYWQKCQSHYPRSLDTNSETALAMLSKCVHGTDYYTENHGSLECPADQSAKNSFTFPWKNQDLHPSWCGRENYFKALIDCFEQPGNNPVPQNGRSLGEVGV